MNASERAITDASNGDVTNARIAGPSDGQRWRMER
jgi:hypothetical protein